MRASGREDAAGGDFVWRDAGRTVVFRAGAADPGALAEHGFASFELLSTPRALAGAPELADAAGAVHGVGPGAVPELAASLTGEVGADRLVALGGGRVIDTAKAIAALSGARVAAIPTTLSGAEMTAIHRLPAGREADAAGLVRPALVLADPDLMTSQPVAARRASAMNALAHGADSLYTPLANPVSRMAALRGAAEIAGALDAGDGEEPRRRLALGSILSAYALDSALFSLHHVICQTLVRTLGLPHAETNAAVLPHAMAALRSRAPGQMADLAAALGAEPARLAERIAALGEPAGLGALGARRDRLEEALDGIEARGELDWTPQRPGRAELAAIVAAAW